MKSLKLLLLIVTISTMSLPNLVAEDIVNAPAQQVTGLTAPERTTLTKSLTKQLTNIEYLAGQISLDISENNITLNNTPEATQCLQGLKNVAIHLYRKIDPTHFKGTDSDLYIFAEIIEGMSAYLQNATKTNFKNIAPFDPSIFIKRGGKNHTLKDAELFLASAEKLTQVVNKALPYIGVNFVRRTARKLKKYSETSNIPALVGGSALVGALGAYLLYSSKEFVAKPTDTDKWYHALGFARKLKPILGTKLELSGTGGYQPGGDSDIKWTLCNQAENMVRPITEFGNMPLVGAAAFAYRDQIKDTIFRKSSELKNWLIGKQSKMDVQHPKKGFEDVIGCTEGKAIAKNIIDYFKNPDLYSRKKLAPQKGVICVGESRAGKTHFVSRFCGQLNQELEKAGKKPIAFIQLEHVFIKTYGLKRAINYHKYYNGDCIFFIDEIHNLDLRSNGNASLLTEFLTLMSGFDEDESNHSIIFAATNQPQSLDTALVQNGRFGTQITFEFPTRAERESYINGLFGKHTLPQDPNYGVLYEELINITENCSYELINDVFEAALKQAMGNEEAVGLEHFYAAIDDKIFGIKPLTKRLQSSEMRTLAIHQAAKMVTLQQLYGQDRSIARATICPTRHLIKEESPWAQALKKDSNERKTEGKYISYGGVFAHNRVDTLNIASGTDLIKEVKTCLAGHVAEEMMTGTAGTLNLSLQQQAVNILKMIIFKNINPNDLSESKRNELLDKVYNLKEECELELREMLRLRKTQIDNLVQLLIQYHTLDTLMILQAVHTQEEIEEMVKKIQEEQAAQQAKTQAAPSTPIEVEAGA